MTRSHFELYFGALRLTPYIERIDVLAEIGVLHAYIRANQAIRQDFAALSIVTQDDGRMTAPLAIFVGGKFFYCPTILAYVKDREIVMLYPQVTSFWEGWSAYGSVRKFMLALQEIL